MSDGNKASAQTDVLIIGAGPSGLMAAQALARMGVKTRIIDRRMKGSLYGNADGLQPRTLEVFESYGIIHQTLSRSARLNGLVIYTAPDDAAGITRLQPGVNIQVKTRYPYEATCSIRTIEGVLEESARKNGLGVEYAVQPTSAKLVGEGDEMRVEVKLESLLEVPGRVKEEVVVHAKYLLGADGERKLMGAKPLQGTHGRGEDTIHMEGNFETTFPDHRFKAIIQHPLGAVIFIPREDNITRIYCQLSEGDIVRTSDGRVDMSSVMKKNNERKVADRIKRILSPYTIEYGEIQWSTVFAVAQMVAARYSIQNRIFLVGDACHMHSPNAGQGANASMADGHNLAWKLAHVLRSWANPNLLDTYEPERRTYAQGLIEFDMQLAKMMNSGNASQYAEMSAQQNMNTSGIGLCYTSTLTLPVSPSLVHGGVKLVPGTRLPPQPITRLADWQAMDLQQLAPSDGMWKLLIFAEPSHDLAPYAERVLSEPRREVIISVILNARVEENKVHWRDVPREFRHWESVFTGSPAPGYLSINGASDSTVFKEFGFGSQGGLIMVRPDGHLSVIESLSLDGLDVVMKFLKGFYGHTPELIR